MIPILNPNTSYRSWFEHNIATHAAIANEQILRINPALHLEKLLVVRTPEDFPPIWLIAVNQLILHRRQEIHTDKLTDSLH
jgi:hypothetical protein